MVVTARERLGVGPQELIVQAPVPPEDVSLDHQIFP